MPLRRILLSPLSLLYHAAVGLRSAAYQRGLVETHSLPGQVISIGNIEVGGTGKSPMVIAAAAFLRDCGHQPAILTRGYGCGLSRQDSMALLGSRILLMPSDDRSYRPDEAMMQAEALGTVPVVVGARRHEAAQRFLNETGHRPTHWLLDDGFQHRRLRRDLDIVLIDRDFKLGRDALLPAGRLREPLSALNRAHVIVLTRGELSQLDAKTQTKLRDLGKPMFGAPFVSMPPKAASSNAKSLAAHQRPGLVTGIARPQRVIDDLHSIGISPHATRLFRDHQHVVLDSSLIASCDALITTAKDWHRDRPVFEACKLPIYVINVRPDLSAAQLSNILGSVL